MCVSFLLYLSAGQGQGLGRTGVSLSAVRPRTTVSNLFGSRDQFLGRQFFYPLGLGGGGGRWFGDDSSALHVHFLSTVIMAVPQQIISH